ncbi:MAG: hypothetical protein U0R70_14020 [Solirubrobacteraceae bacterium]
MIAPSRTVLAIGAGFGALTTAVAVAPAVVPAAAASAPAAAGSAAAAPVALTTRSSGAPVNPSAATLAAQARAGRTIAASGRIGMPSGLALSAGCSGRVTVTARRAGAAIAKRTATVSRSGSACRWSTTLSLPASTPAGSAVTVSGRYGGNSYLKAKSTPTRTVTVRA